MVRVSRISAAGFMYHVTQRGNNRQDVFFVDNDRKKYLDFLKEESNKYGLEIEGYCLMTNHVHLVVRPKNKNSLSKALGRTHYRYTIYINRVHTKSGHLWQNRFFSCPLDESHYWTVMRYIERNPVRANIVNDAWAYEWSSATAHAGMKEDSSELLNMGLWAAKVKPENWRLTLSEVEDTETTNIIREKTNSGLPLGDQHFLESVESESCKIISPSKP